MISHKHRRKETTNGGLSTGRRCGGSYFPVWCCLFLLTCEGYRSLREKRRVDGFSVCPSTVHSWKTDTRCRPAHTLEDYGLTIAVRLILPTVEINR
jgi:hypothetical protein